MYKSENPCLKMGRVGQEDKRSLKKLDRNINELEFTPGLLFSLY